MVLHAIGEAMLGRGRGWCCHEEMVLAQSPSRKIGEGAIWLPDLRFFALDFSSTGHSYLPMA